jgi:hypothetical protein
VDEETGEIVAEGELEKGGIVKEMEKEGTAERDEMAEGELGAAVVEVEGARDREEMAEGELGAAVVEVEGAARGEEMAEGELGAAVVEVEGAREGEEMAEGELGAAVVEVEGAAEGEKVVSVVLETSETESTVLKSGPTKHRPIVVLWISAGVPEHMAAFVPLKTSMVTFDPLV